MLHLVDIFVFLPASISFFQRPRGLIQRHPRVTNNHGISLGF